MQAGTHVVLWSAVAILGLAAATVESAPVKTPAKKAQVKKNAGANHAQVIAELQRAKQLLDHANHAHNPHRAKADREIAHAIQILHGKTNQKGNTTRTTSARRRTTTTRNANRGANVANPAADANLRAAEKLVRQALHQLQHGHIHHGRAASKPLHHAIREIEMALRHRNNGRKI